jgi:hypothetical protein
LTWLNGMYAVGARDTSATWTAERAQEEVLTSVVKSEFDLMFSCSVAKIKQVFSSTKASKATMKAIRQQEILLGKTEGTEQDDVVSLVRNLKVPELRSFLHENNVAIKADGRFLKKAVLQAGAEELVQNADPELISEIRRRFSSGLEEERRRWVYYFDSEANKPAWFDRSPGGGGVTVFVEPDNWDSQCQMEDIEAQEEEEVEDAGIASNDSEPDDDDDDDDDDDEDDEDDDDEEEEEDD